MSSIYFFLSPTVSFDSFLLSLAVSFGSVIAILYDQVLGSVIVLAAKVTL